MLRLDRDPELGNNNDKRMVMVKETRNSATTEIARVVPHKP